MNLLKGASLLALAKSVYYTLYQKRNGNWSQGKKTVYVDFEALFKQFIL